MLALLISLTMFQTLAYDPYNCWVRASDAYVVENDASGASKADDYLTAYTNYQDAAKIRDHCASVTSGSVHVDHMLWEALDLIGEAYSASLTDTYADQQDDLLASAAGVTHDIAQLPLTSAQYRQWVQIKNLLGSSY